MSQPCLKAQPPYPADSPLNPFPFATCRDFQVSLHVHFPPSPSLTSIHTTHSPTVYDRAPIAVSPNLCAMPERGRRVYTEGPTVADYFHPHAFTPPESLTASRSPSSSAPGFSPGTPSDEGDGTSQPSSPGAPPSISIRHHLAPPLPPPPRFSLVPPRARLRGEIDADRESSSSFLLLCPPKGAKRRCPSRHPRTNLNRTHESNSTFEVQVPLHDDGCLGGF